MISKAEQDVLKQQKLFERGVITNQERYNKVLDTWTHAREQITKSMMVELEGDTREGGKYVNPIFLMASSGAGWIATADYGLTGELAFYGPGTELVQQVDRFADDVRHQTLVPFVSG